jgi:transposase
MRGSDEQNGALFSYVNLEDRVPARDPLRVIREIVNTALARLDAEFANLYAAEGRRSIPPERLLRAVLIRILFSIRSERQLMEQMHYILLFRWFVGLGIDDPVWVPTVFTKNRDRLRTTDIAGKLLAAILADKAVKPPLSDEHFSVDGTLIRAWASLSTIAGSMLPSKSSSVARTRSLSILRLKRRPQVQLLHCPCSGIQACGSARLLSERRFSNQPPCRAARPGSRPIHRHSDRAPHSRYPRTG